MNKPALMSIALLCAIGFSSPTAAFRSTKVEGHTDPDFTDYQPKKVMIVVVGATTEMRQQIDERMSSSLSAYGVDARPERSVFPPTREWDDAMKNAVLAKQGFDSILIVGVGASSARIIPVAMQTYGSANTTGRVNQNGTFNATTTGQSTTYNIMSAKSSAEFSGVLVEAATGRTVWFGDVITKAGGTLFVGEKGDAKASVKGVVEGLEENGHISRTSKRR